MYLRAHGNIDFKIQNRCVINKPNTAFNEEGVNLLFSHILEEIKTKRVDEWVLIEVLRENALPTPEAMRALVENYKKAKEQGCIKIAAVCKVSLQKHFLSSIAEKAKVNICFYTSENEATEDNEHITKP